MGRSEADGGQPAPTATAQLALLGTAVHEAGEAVLITTADLDAPGPQIVFANPAAARLTGYAVEELVGRTPRVLQGPRTSRAELDRVRAHLVRGEPYAGRILNYRKDGSEYVIDWHIAPLRAVGASAEDGVAAHGPRVGPITHFVAVQRDVTAEVRAAAERERLLADAGRARHEAEQAGRLKSEFLATMSHEFRTPLNAIVGYAQLLELGVLGATTPAQHDHLARLQASARHLLRLVDDVLDVAKVDADRLAVRREVLTTQASVAAAVALVQPQATARGVHLVDLGPAPGASATGGGAGDGALPDGVPPSGVPAAAVLPAGVPYVGDEHRVRQILVNLLANAVQFTPAGGEVTIHCGRADAPDPGAQPGGPGRGSADHPAGHGWAYVRVRDTGPGVAAELRGRLFEPFVQGDGSHTRPHGGTGLGLAISRRLARLMGGDLTVDGRDAGGSAGSGATFTLWLPQPPLPAPPVSVAEPDHARRTPPGVPVVTGPGAPLDDAAYAMLHALGARLAADAEAVAQRFVVALRAEGRFPGADVLPAVQLRDHASPSVGLLATRLMVIGETRGRAPELLGDGGQVQRLMDELHGAQRQRLGWSEADLAREAPLFLAEMEHALAGALEHVVAHAQDPRAADAASTAQPADAARAAAVAARYAADVVRHAIEQGARTALRAYRFAKAAAAP